MIHLFLPCAMHQTVPLADARRACSLSVAMLMISGLAPLAAFAQQNTAVLAGRVLDAANGSPIGFASVVVEDAASGKQLSGALTGENGRFVVQGLPPGTYKVRISFVGYYPADTDLLVSHAESVLRSRRHSSSAPGGIRRESDGHGARRSGPPASTPRCFVSTRALRSPRGRSSTR